MSKLFPAVFFVSKDKVTIRCNLCRYVQGEGFVIAVELPSKPVRSLALANPIPLACAGCNRTLTVNPKLFEEKREAEAELAALLLRFAANDSCSELCFAVDRY